MKILSGNETGFGFLIENDAGYISPKLNNKFINEVKSKINESKFDFSNPTIVAVMQKYGVENKNGRIYPQEILEREVENYKKLIKLGASAGENDHAESSVIHIKNTSMRITNLWWEGRTLMGEIYLPITKGYIERGIISHPADKIAHDMLHGFQYGVSSRGVGSVEAQNGKNIVQEDFEIICWDFVTTPSTHGAWIAKDKNKLKQYVESAEPSNYEINEKERNSKFDEDDAFGVFKKSKQRNVEQALNRFFKGI